jgi:hypothetical protein
MSRQLRDICVRNPRSLLPVKAATMGTRLRSRVAAEVPSNAAVTVCPLSPVIHVTRNRGRSHVLREVGVARAIGSIRAARFTPPGKALPCARIESLARDPDGPTGAICAVSFITRRLTVLREQNRRRRSSWASISVRRPATR